MFKVGRSRFKHGAISLSTNLFSVSNPHESTIFCSFNGCELQRFLSSSHLSLQLRSFPDRVQTSAKVLMLLQKVGRSRFKHGAISLSTNLFSVSNPHESTIFCASTAVIL